MSKNSEVRSRRGEALGKQPGTKIDNLSPECFARKGVRSRRGEALGKQPGTKIDNLSPECFARKGVRTTFNK
ncbi:hypothetical protein [Sphaerospermopsis sp. FACHB-1194]|uniref:hypothetical protein n=1 Tax=Sphaerospermopsis sp. FACHB-1194 TaxID=2692862 RepID=UPI0016811D49|nr:hypothetical protein [Sphaerospermopsis sp. FACHB-1194]MBD2147388.1 hypothetical protein [Sphaerospermopsis sp. FACHB-1194]